jgi:acetolactate synthase-1/2/3 large subunit
MNRIGAGEIIADILAQHGIKYLFGLPGGHIYPMMEACEERGIKFIGTRHEMNAAFMAEGWALTTGEIGFCAGTAGPGFTNLLTGIANSFAGRIPVICIAGKAGIGEFDRNALQDFNQIDMIKSVTKYARTILDVRRIPEYIGRAIAEAVSDCPGPVYIEIPKDVMESSVNAEEIKMQRSYVSGSRPCGNPEDIKKALELINSAERPIIVAGGGVWWAKAAHLLREFAEISQIPVFTRNAGRGSVPDDHPLGMGIAASRHPVFRIAAQATDLVLFLGTRPNYILTPDTFTETCKIIRVDIRAAELRNLLDVDLAIQGDCGQVLRQLISGVKEKDRSQWIESIRRIQEMVKKALEPLMLSDRVPIHPMRLCYEVSKFVKKDTIVVIDGGDAALFGNFVLPALGAGQYLSIAGTNFGPLGVGVPYAMAAKLAHPDKDVLLFTGDGAFGYGIMEYETAIRYGINFTAVVLNDAHWGMIMRSEAKKRLREKFVGLKLSEVRYDKMVEALGGYGELVTEPDEIGTAIREALASNKPAVVNVMTDPSIGFVNLEEFLMKKLSGE